MANSQITDLELQREVEALRTRRRQSVNRVVLDPDLPDLQGPGLFSESRPSLDRQTSVSSATSSYHPPKTPPDVDSGAFPLSDKTFHTNPPLFGSSQRERYLARRNARAAQAANVTEKGPLPRPPTSRPPPHDPNALLWVPAGAHPEISPADFRSFMKEQAERNVSQHETESRMTGNRGSLSPPLDAHANEQGEATVAASRLLHRNSSMARRASSLRRQIRPEDREALTDADAGRLSQPSHLTSGFAGREPSERPANPSSDGAHQLLGEADDDRSSTGTHGTHSTDSESDYRPLPTPGMPQLHRRTRNVKLARPHSPQAQVRGARPPAPPTSPRRFPENIASTIEALALDPSPASATAPQTTLVDEPESMLMEGAARADAPPLLPQRTRQLADTPRRGNTLPSRLEDSTDAAELRRAAIAAELRAKVSSKDALPELPTDQAPPRRSLERVPVPSVPSRHSDEEVRARAGPRPLPEPTRPRGEARPLPEPKGTPAYEALEPVVDPRVMERAEPRPVPPPPAPRPAAVVAPDKRRPVPEPPRAAATETMPPPPPDPRSDARLDGHRTSRDRRGFGLSWFGLAKEDEVDDHASKRREKEERRKAKEEVPPPPPLLPTPSVPPPKRKEKDTFLASLFGKRKNHDQDSLRHRARTLFNGAHHSGPPQVVDDFPYTRFPLHVERALYRLSHFKLANPRRPLQEQVVISNLMFWYLAVVNSAQSRPAEIGNHNPRQPGESEYDDSGRRAMRGTPPVSMHTGILVRAVPQYMPPSYMAYGMGMVPAWGFPTGYSPSMYMDPHTQSWMPAPVQPSMPPQTDYDVNEYVLDGYYAPAVPTQADMPPEEMPFHASDASGWSAAAEPLSTPPMHDSSPVPPPPPSKPPRDMLVNSMPMHAPGPGVQEAPGAMERQNTNPALRRSAERSATSLRSLRPSRSSPALGPRKATRTPSHPPRVPPVPAPLFASRPGLRERP